MRVANGTVVAGKVVVDGEPFADGAKVTILAPEENETFTVSAVEEALLLESIAEADRGELVDADELLRELSQPK